MSEDHQQVAVITGAAGEIPAEIARLFAARGTQLLLSDVDEPALARLAEELRTDTRVETLRQDVASADDAEALAQHCRKHYGRVDHVITGAGLYEHLPLAEIDPERWRRSLAINLDGVFYTIQALRPLLTEGSSVVNITSVAGHRGSPDHTPYAAAKGGVLTLTRSLAQELGPRTRVNAVSPGLIDTRMMQSLDARRREAMTAAMPLQRLGSSREVAEVVLFLCSPAAGYVTAETIHVNGGLYIAG